MKMNRHAAHNVTALSILVAVVLAGCKREGAAQSPWKSGTTIIPGTLSWDVESGSFGAGNGTDFSWQHLSATERYLVPENGTEAAVVKHRSYEQIDSLFLQRWHMPKERISGSDSDGLLTPGTVIAFRTAEGTLGKLQVVGFRPLDDLSFPEAGAYPEGWKNEVADLPNIERYHIEIRWTLFQPGLR
jgi:hypothetical protein